MIAWETDDRARADLGRVLERVLPHHPHAGEVTRAVEMWAGGAPGTPVLASDRALWQAAQALAAVGDRGAASAVLSVTGGWSAWSELVDPTRVPAMTSRLMECGLIQAFPSAVLGDGVLVRLDLRRLAADAAGLELAYLPLVRRLVEACAPLWEEAGGGGALVIQGLDRHAGSLRPVGRWLERAFRDALRDAGARHGWSRSPFLVRVD